MLSYRTIKRFMSLNITGSPFFSQRMCGFGLPLATQDIVYSLPRSFSVLLMCSTHSGKAESDKSKLQKTELQNLQSLRKCCWVAKRQWIHMIMLLSISCNIFVTFYRHSCSVIVLSSWVHCLTPIGAVIFKLHIKQVQLSPCHPHLMTVWQVSTHLLPVNLWDRAGMGRVEKIINRSGFNL